MTPAQWRSWATSIEKAAGPILFVGDAHTAELYMALKSLTGGALHSEYMASDSLTNTHTLAPMTSEQLDACIARSAAGTSPVPNSHRAEPPCPPEDRNLAYHWEDNRFHRLRNLVWTQKLTELEQVNHYRTLVLGTGSQLWRQHAYPAFVSECATSGGVADAFLPITTLGLADWQGCDVFGVRYPIIVQNIARFLGNLRMGTQYFEGHVIFVTSPPHTPGCDGVSAPNEGGTVPADVVWASQYVTKPEHYYQQVQYAETVWRSAFQKWAPRLKLSILNVTQLSEARADARAPGDCGRLCFPGVPHVWAEMLLRLLEQHG